MRKFIAIILILFVAFLTLECDAATKRKKPFKTKTRVEIEAKDGFLLVGDLYFAQQRKPPRPLVVLLHSFGTKGTDWGTLPEDLRLKNYNVLALDLRGHGRSVKNSKLQYKSRLNFTKEDWLKYPVDVIAALEFVKKNYPRINSDEVYIVGADIGANSAVLAASVMKVKPVKIVLISPYMTFKGLEIANILPKLNTVPMMVMASRADALSYSQADMIFRLIHSPKIFKIYPQGGSGNVLLKRNPSSYTEIINYISGK